MPIDSTSSEGCQGLQSSSLIFVSCFCRRKEEYHFLSQNHHASPFSKMAALQTPRQSDSSLMVVEDTDERTTHKASCHCGAIQFEVTLKYAFPKYPINKCTCSICTKNGYLFVYPCRRDVIFTRGELSIGALDILYWYLDRNWEPQYLYVEYENSTSQVL